MRIEAYTKDHIGMMNEWYYSRGLPSMTEDFLPSIGFICLDVAAGFLYQTDTKVALLEGYISNPKANADKRYAALDQITEMLINKAKELGFTTIGAISKIEGALKYCDRFGFEDLGNHKFYLKGL